MTRVVVAGMVSVRVACRVASFPVPLIPSQRQADGFSIRLASVGWTTARTLQRLGTDVSLATYVGGDPAGQLAVDGLRRAGLYGAATLVCSSQPRSMVLYDNHGRRSSTRNHPFTSDTGYPVDVFMSMLDDGSGCDLAVLTSVGFTRSLIPAVVARGIPIATDLQLVTDIDRSPYQDRMRASHILACSHERLTVSPETWAVQLWDRFRTGIVLVGCGPAGAVLGVRATRSVWRIDAIAPRGVSYTSGAGDTLLATFVHHHLQLDDPVRAARYAVLAAGWKVGSDPAEEPGIAAETLAALARHGLPAVHRLR